MSVLIAQASAPAHPHSTGTTAVTAIDLLNGYAHVFTIAFVVTLIATPLAMRAAQAIGVVDRPDFNRKAHTHPIPYLGGMAVFAGVLAAIAVSYLPSGDAPIAFAPVPMAVVIGMIAITFTGLADDIWGWDPRLKIAGQLVAAAGLAIENVGVNVAHGVLTAIFPGSSLSFTFATPMGDATVDIVYWVGTALIALFVLGGCNAANLIDGLDGLLSGVSAITAIGLLLISIFMLHVIPDDAMESETGVLAGARLVLCLAILGATLGFLPYNWKPAVIFLGDCGSLLLGYLIVVVILMLGEHGQTHLVFAGLIVFAIPIIDTTLAIIRRKLAGVSMSAADNQHLHHQFRRVLGGVRRAVMAMYALSILFMVVGVSLAGLVIFTELRVRAVYAVALVLGGMLGVVAVKAARRQQRLAASTASASSTATAKTTDRAVSDDDAHAKSADEDAAHSASPAPAMSASASSPRNGAPIGRHA
ncbi:MAG TPA: MraY family glycosyltransferase [Phycisphaerales bacterium]|nr:MraY family glycosyltransferase [Phycisphaerales bacterium]